ncbi:hypothetical protein HDU76_010766 [Blyttiomyces sp. JEL0837]|nr:hypothetical protein HDU76_010766 [Blyttiomyces sp. JEL0837]
MDIFDCNYTYLYKYLHVDQVEKYTIAHMLSAYFNKVDEAVEYPEVEVENSEDEEEDDVSFKVLLDNTVSDSDDEMDNDAEVEIVDEL